MCVRRRAVGLAILAAMILGGCAAPSGPGTRGGYRTVTTEPCRDTETARHHNQAGLKLLEEGRLDEAATAFERALTADVEFGPAHNNLGKVHYRKGQWYKAAWEFEYARNLLPKHVEPRNNLGLVLENAGELDRAVEQYRQAVALDARPVEYRANLARALVRRGDCTEELRVLLRKLVQEDCRAEWQLWARQQLARLGE